MVSMRASGHYSDPYLIALEETVALLATYAEEQEWPSVDQLTTPHIEEYLTYLQTRPWRFGDQAALQRTERRRLSKSTIEAHYSRIKTFFKWLVDRGQADSNPVDAIPHPKPEDKVVSVVDVPDKLKLLKLVDPRYAKTFGDRFRAVRNRALFMILFDTPGRLKELAGIRASDVDLDQGMVKVMGKGSRGRRMPLGAVATEALWEYMKVRSQVTPLHVDALWVTQAGKKMQPNWLYLTVKRIGERVGIAGLHPHQFRHTYAVEAMMNQMPQRILEVIGGWRQIPATYLRTISEEQAAEIHRLVSPADQLRNGRLRGSRRTRL